MELNEIGENYLNALEAQMKDLEIYLHGDRDLMLTDCALQYQLYKQELDNSLNYGIDENARKNHHMNMSRHLKIVQDMQKQLGIGPLQRHKLKAFKEIQKEQSIQDIISESLAE